MKSGDNQIMLIIISNSIYKNLPLELNSHTKDYVN